MSAFGPFDLVVIGQVVAPSGVIPDGWVAVRAGAIAALGSGTRPAASRVHAAGADWVFPWFIDGQVHACSYGGYVDLESTTRSAVAGGITTIVDMPYDNPDPLDTADRLACKQEAIARSAVTDVALYGTVASGPGVRGLGALAEGGVCALKVSSFESHPVRFPRMTSAEIMDVLAASVDVGLPVGLHNEDQDFVRAATAALKRAGRETPEWRSPSRPLAAEMAATASFLEFGAATGAHVHLVHLLSPAGYALVSRYRADGVKATAEMCAHYLHFDAARDSSASARA